MMPRTIVYILGTSFSGSSLLNSLLDAQPGIRGLGEAVHLLVKPTSAWCSHCRCHVDQCRLQDRVNPSRFYESVFEAYAGSEVIVNSSKHWGLCFRYMPIPAEAFRIRIIVLSKSPEEFTFSYASHQGCGYEEAIHAWLKFYEFLFLNLDAILTHTPQSDIQQRLSSRVGATDVMFLTYRQLASQPDRTLAELSLGLDLPHVSNYHDSLWRGDTCTIGGNNAIFAQCAQNATFFGPDRNYLNGKYRGRMGSIFYDDAWTSDPLLIQAVNRFQDSYGDRLHGLRQRLGHSQEAAERGSVASS